jgi:hypothetical protein
MASLRLAVATRYWHSARIVIAAQIRPVEYLEPVGYLLAMSAELALKAFLMEGGVPEKNYSQGKVGHDLAALLRLSVDHGLELGELDAAAILSMREAHSRHFLRYAPSDMSNELFVIALSDQEQSLVALGHLLDLVAGDPRMLRWQHQHPLDFEWPLALPPHTPVSRARLGNMIEEAAAYAQLVSNLPHQVGSKGSNQ